MKYILSLCCFMFMSPLYAQKVVNVGAYEFPPFFEVENGQVEGIGVELIELFNQVQNDYRFVIKLTSPKRRYLTFEQKEVDMYFFESIHWGWSRYSIEPTKVFLKGGEKFIALKKSGRNQGYFENIKEKKACRCSWLPLQIC